MKKVLFALMLLFAGSVITSCTNDQTEDEIEFLAIDKDKQECTGCDDNGSE